MAQAQIFTGAPTVPVSGKQLCLLSLDGGGVRGLSSLQILKQLMELIDPEHPPKPCDYFDMIGGTSTGGLIAIMLGRLRMDVDECITEYKRLSSQVFTHCKHRLTWRGKLQGRFDHDALERGIKALLVARNESEDALLKDPLGQSGCRTFLCTTSQETNDLVVLTSYYAKRWGTGMYNSAKIWEAARATSAATSFFDPIKIGSQQFVDGATSANNPVSAMWVEAYNHWKESDEWRLEDNLQCLVSIGTGKPSLIPFGQDPFEIGRTLLQISTDTENVAENFQRSHDTLFKRKTAFRFNVAQGLETVGLEEAQREGDIISATNRYIAIQDVQESLDACAEKLKSLPKILQSLVRQHLSAPIADYGAYQQHSRAYDVECYINTDVVQNLWDETMSLIWCPTAPDDHQQQLAAALMTRLYKSRTSQALYYSFSPHTVATWRNSDQTEHLLPQALRKAGDKAGASGPEVQMLCIFLSSLICQIITGWPHDETDRPLSLNLDRPTLSLVMTALSLFARVEDIASVLQLVLSRPAKPTILFVDQIHHLRDSELEFVVTELKKLIRAANQPFRVVLSGRYSESTMKHLGGLRCIDHLSEYQECLRSLTFDEFNVRRDQVDHATKGTNEWIWQHPSYQAFAGEGASLLWIQGKPGSGKSVLAKSIVTRLGWSPSPGNNLPSTSKTKILVSDWFYHRRGGARFVTHNGLFLSMALHFLQQEPRVLRHFLCAYRQSADFPKPGIPSQKPSTFQWTRELLQSALEDIIRSGESLLVVTDALDEAEDATVLEWVVKLVKHHSVSSLKFIVLSRPGPSIEKHLMRFHRILVERENQHDLSVVVDEGLAKARAALHYYDFESCAQDESTQPEEDAMSLCEPDWILDDPSATDSVQTEEAAMNALREFLLANSKSSMLWVKLVLHDAKCQLEEGLTSFSDLYEALRHLPPELEEYYKQIAAELPRPKGKSQQGRTRKILMLVSVISEIRALTLEELWEAMSTPLEMETEACGSKRPETLMASNYIRPHSYDEFRRILQSICGPFLEFLDPPGKAGARQPSQSRSLVVQLMHQTVKDFLCDPKSSGPLYFTSDEASSLVKGLAKAYKELALQQYVHLLEENAAVCRVSKTKDRVVTLSNLKPITIKSPIAPTESQQQTQALAHVVNWFNHKCLLPCASQVLHGEEDLSDFYDLTFGNSRLFDQDLLLSSAAEHGRHTAIKTMLLISKAAPGQWLDQHHNITHHIILAAARTRIPSFEFTCVANSRFCDRFSGPGDPDTDDCWITVPWELTVNYKPRNLKLTTAFKGWSPLLDQICGSRKRSISTSRLAPATLNIPSVCQNSVHSSNVEQALALVMDACCAAQAVELGFHWSWENDLEIVRQLNPEGLPNFMQELPPKMLEMLLEIIERLRPYGAWNLKHELRRLPDFTEQLKPDQHDRLVEFGLQLAQEDLFVLVKKLPEIMAQLRSDTRAVPDLSGDGPDYETRSAPRAGKYPKTPAAVYMDKPGNVAGHHAKTEAWYAGKATSGSRYERSQRRTPEDNGWNQSRGKGPMAEKAILIMRQQKLNALLCPRATIRRPKSDMGDFEDDDDVTYRPNKN